MNDAALAANRGYQLFSEIKGRLDTVQTSISNRIAQLLQSGDMAEFQQLDDNYLAGNSFTTRADRPEAPRDKGKKDAKAEKKDKGQAAGAAKGRKKKAAAAAS